MTSPLLPMHLLPLCLHPRIQHYSPQSTLRATTLVHMEPDHVQQVESTGQVRNKRQIQTEPASIVSFLIRGECACADSTTSMAMLCGMLLIMLVLVHVRACARYSFPLSLYLLLTPTPTVQAHVHRVHTQRLPPRRCAEWLDARYGVVTPSLYLHTHFHLLRAWHLHQHTWYLYSCTPRLYLHIRRLYLRRRPRRLCPHSTFIMCPGR
jgi:hypothetical protein